MSQIIVFNKPFRVLSQFTDKEKRATLKDYLSDFPGFYVAGRLDFDSEGLLLLTDNGAMQHRISQPDQKMPKTYWVQVEGDISEQAMAALRQGILLKDGKTQPAKLEKLAPPPHFWPRHPPIRVRQNQPTSWIRLTLYEGRNRQVRRMTAHVGFPTLRLIRTQIGHWSLNDLSPGDFRMETIHIPRTRTTKKRKY